MKIKRSVALQQQTSATSSLVQHCLESVAEDAVLKVASQGGYYEVSNPIHYNLYSIPVYYNKGQESVPTLEDVQGAIAAYVSANIMSCTGDFPSLHFPAEPLRQARATVSIGKEVGIELDWPIRVGGEEQVTVSDFSAGLEADLTGAYGKAMELYEEQKDVRVMSLIDLAELAKDRDYVLHFDFDEEAVLYLLIFDETIIRDQPLVYTFAVRPKEGEEEYVFEDLDLTELFAPSEGTEEEELEEEDFEF
jgi:hypothetical protein